MPLILMKLNELLGDSVWQTVRREYSGKEPVTL